MTERLSVEEANNLRADYNFILNMAAADETGSLIAFWRELRKFIRASKGNRTKIDAYVNRELPKQPFFSGLTGAQIEARIQEARPELAADVERAIERQQLFIQQMLENAGVNLPEEQTRQIAEEARRNNLSQFEISLRLRPLIEQAVREGQELMGLAGDAETQLLSWARSNGLSLSRESIARYINNIALGRQSIEDAKQDIRRTYMAGMFPAWADRINEGDDPIGLFEPYRDAARRLLEIDEIDFDDPIMTRATQGLGPDGKPARMPLYEFERQVRQDPRWQYTDNAYSTYTNVGTELLRMFGFR